MNTSNPALQSPEPLVKSDFQLISLVAIAHMFSHFAQLVLPPLFPFIKDSLQVSYAELGFLMSIFFVVSCAVQALSGFAVDRFGPRPVLYLGLSSLVLANWGYAISDSYTQMMFCAFLAGVGNGVFHPVDYTLLNRLVTPARLGHAYSVHGITGSLGWAVAPALMVPIAIAFSWHVALFVAGSIGFAILVLLLFKRSELELPVIERAKASGEHHTKEEGTFDFLKIPVVWICFSFFLLYSGALSIIQAYAPEAVRHLQSVPLSVTASCLTLYMVCSAFGMFLGGFLASNAQRAEKVVGIAFFFAGCLSLSFVFAELNGWQVLMIFGLMGLISGSASPSRDLLVKKSAPENATGRIYGVVYSGLDIGQALSAFIFGVLMDHQNYTAVILGLSSLQAILVVGALNVKRARRDATTHAVADRI
jgi:predicted MFS family arabinose efflux permease